MSYATAMSLVKAVLDSTSGVINTFDHIPRKETVAEMVSNFVDSSIFHTWWMRRVDIDPVEEQTSFQVYRNHNIEIIGLYQVDDSAGSEATFQALVDAVLNKLDDPANISLDASHDQVEAPQLIEFIEVEGGSIPILSHRARILVQVNEVVNL